MQHDDARHHGPGDAMPGDTCGDRGAIGAPLALRAVVPWSTCVFAAALWSGCAIAGGSPWARSLGAPCAGAIVTETLIVALACAAGASVIAAQAMRSRRASRRMVCMALGLLAAAGFTLGIALRFDETIAASRKPRLHLPEDGQLVRLEATLRTPFAERGFAVDRLARHLGKSTRFVGHVGDVVFIDEAGEAHPLADREALLSVSVLDEPPRCRVADRIRVVGTIRGTRTPGLPGDGRIAEAMLHRGVIGSVSVDSPALVGVAESAGHGSALAAAIARARDSARERIRTALVEGVPDAGDASIRAMLVALVLGDAEDGYRAIENSFRAVGLSHILAISGFNLAVLGWLVGLAARLVSPSPRVHAVACGIAACCALLLMAPAASAVRSALMAIVGASGSAVGREWNGDAVLAVAAIVMLLSAPSDALNPGFQLSFACVLALRHLSMPVQASWLRWIPGDAPIPGRPALLGIAGEFLARAVAAGLAAFIASTPIVLVHFGSIQPVGTLLTLACAPLSTATLMLAYPKAVLGALWPPLTVVLAWPAWFAAVLQIELVELAIRCGAGSIALGGAHWSLGAALAVAGCGSILSRGRRMRIVAAAAAAALVFLPPMARSVREDRPHFECTVFAIGDGTAMAIESSGALVLFDGGSTSIGNVASRALLPWIDARGGVVDAVIISHPDLDHMSALADVARYSRVDRAYMHDSLLAAEQTNQVVAELLSTMRGRGVELHAIAAGDSVRLGNAEWRVLWPPAGFRSRRDNDLSLVIAVAIDGNGGMPCARVLLSGDIETEPAARLAAMARRGEIDLGCDVLEMPHHGSWREAVVDYISAARPRFIVQSTASRRFARDRFGPHLPPDTRRLVTCRDGTIRLSIDPMGGIEAGVLDESAEGGYRPAGHATSRRRPRRVRWFWRSSGLKKEAASMDGDAVARDTIAAILDDDLEHGILRRSTDDANRLAPVVGIENQRLVGRACEANGHGDACVGRDGFPQRDLGAEHDLSLESSKCGRQVETRVERSIELDRSEAEKRLFASLEASLRSLLISIGRGGAFVRGCAARHKGDHRSAVKEDRRRLRRRRPDRSGFAAAEKHVVGEEEAPPGIGLVREALRSNDAPVDGPHQRVGRSGLLKRGEGHGCDSIDRNASRGAGLLRRWLGTHCLAAIGRVLARITAGRVRVDRLEHDLVADRLDETCGRVAVHEENHVGVGSLRSAAIRHEPHLGDGVCPQRNGSDPAVLPDGGPCVGAECPGKKLPVRKDERTDAELREKCKGSTAVRADEACDDARPRNRSRRLDRAAVDLGERPSPVPEGLESAREPVPVTKQKLDPAAVGGDRDSRRGFGAKARRGKRAADGRRKGKGAEKSGQSVQGSGRRHCVVLALEDGKVALRHLEHDERHRRPVGVALWIRPRSIRILLGKKLVPDRGPPRLPAIATRKIHGLHGVVVTVEVVRLGKATRKSSATARKRVLLEIVKPALDRLVFIHARVEEARHARGRTWPRRTTEVLHVSEATIRVLARADIPDRVVDRRLRNLDAGVPRASQRHDLTYRHGHVRIVRYRVVAPASLVVLAAHDQLHRAHEGVADAIVILVHSVDLAKEERGETVSIHGTMGLVGHKKARLSRVVEDEVERFLHALSELSAAGKVPIGHQRDRAKARHADVLTESSLTEGAVGLLLASEVLESLPHGLLETRGDLRFARSVLGAALPKGNSARGRWCWVRGHWRRCGRRVDAALLDERYGAKPGGKRRQGLLIHVLILRVSTRYRDRRSSCPVAGCSAGIDEHSHHTDRCGQQDRQPLVPVIRMVRGPPSLGG